MTTLSIFAPDLSGTTGMYAFVRRSDTGELVNIGGDALSESPVSSGRFECTVAETLPTVVCSVAVYSGSSETAATALIQGWLPSGGSLVTDTYQSDASQTTLLEVQSSVNDIDAAVNGGFLTQLLAAIEIDTASIAEFPTELIQGDSYIEELNRHISVLALDTAGDPISGLGSLDFADSTITGYLARLGKTDEIRMTVEFVPGTNPYWKIQIPSSETRKAVPNEPYFGQLKHVWTTPVSARHTIKGIQTKFVPDVDVQ